MKMGHSRLLLFFHVALIHLVIIPTAAQYCYNTGNYTSSSTYRANLYTLLGSMINNIKINYGFYNFSSGEAPDKVYGIALCRGDTSPSDCRSCIDGATSDLLKACPNQKEAIIWTDKCSLRYSFRSIFNVMEANPLITFYNTGDVPDVEAFNNVLFPLLNSLKNRTASGNSTYKFAAQSASAPNFQTIYALLECTPDLSKLECNSCLEQVQSYIPQCCNGKQGGKFVSPSCDIRFEVYSFYDPSVEPPPSPLPPSPSPPLPESPTTTPACGDKGRYTTNSTYEANLNDVLSTISSNKETENGFYNFSIGTEPDKVYAIGLCGGNVKPDICRSCLNDSRYRLTQLCPTQKEAIGWNDNCMLRFSNHSIFGIMETQPLALIITKSVSELNGYKQIQPLFDSMKSEAASGGSRKFATRNSSTIYMLAQCTPDLLEAACSDCLDQIYQKIPLGTEVGRFYTPSCNYRFESHSSAKGKKRKKARTAIIIAVPSVIAMMLTISTCIFHRMRKSKDNFEIVEGIESVESLQYDLSTIRAATNNFSDANKLGKGGFGIVYKGNLLNGQEIAVKRLSKNSQQGDFEFKNEVLLVAKLQHRNLVRLLGFCLEGNERLLIYEFVSNRSLDYYIFDPMKRAHINWERRYKIIKGIARGLLYLHEDSRLRIIHRDLKASNILLDAEMNPKISDFGMARMFVLDQTEGSTNRIVGTYGYMALEYAMLGQFSTKSDVFSFGVLILEVLSGQKITHFHDGENTEYLLSYFLLHLIKEKEKSTCPISAFLDAPFEQSPHVLCKWALPKQGCLSQVVGGKFRCRLNSNPSPVKILARR
ncbi:hypothetical protein SO802_007595 [Lithocarpus litseifolius]|uniref:Uncharacterized protein n=1 Tax=Lithocarpus litseifolius TaxID=425828 RepID=A0AAW2DP22_9ROSI